MRVIFEGSAYEQLTEWADIDLEIFWKIDRLLRDIIRWYVPGWQILNDPGQSADSHSLTAALEMHRDYQAVAQHATGMNQDRNLTFRIERAHFGVGPQRAPGQHFGDVRHAEREQLPLDTLAVWRFAARQELYVLHAAPDSP